MIIGNEHIVIIDGAAYLRVATLGKQFNTKLIPYLDSDRIEAVNEILGEIHQDLYADLLKEINKNTGEALK